MAANRQRTSGTPSNTVELSTEDRKTASIALISQIEHDAKVLEEKAADTFSNPNTMASEDCRSWFGELSKSVAALDAIGWPRDLWPKDPPAEAEEGR